MAKSYDVMKNFYLAWRDAFRQIGGDGGSIDGIGVQDVPIPGGSSWLGGLAGGYNSMAYGSGFFLTGDLATRGAQSFIEPDLGAAGSSMYRLSRYAEADYLDAVPEVHSALDTYADESTMLDEDGSCIKITTKNAYIKEELSNFLRKRLEIENELWQWMRDLCKLGDHFMELVIDYKHPERGIIRVNALPARTMWRIETRRGRTLEFQQSVVGPDYACVIADYGSKGSGAMSSAVLPGSKGIRFSPEMIVHTRIGGRSSPFYPYGVGILVTARRPAHQLRLMEDAMLVYRLSRSPERRVFYIDVQQTPPNKVEMFLQRFKDKLKKKKTYNATSGSVDERYNPLSIDEDFFLPVRGNQTGTRIDTLPGACLALNTDIPLLDGKTKQLSEVIDDFNNGVENWIYSCDPDNGNVVNGKIAWAGVTRYNTQVIRIALSNDKQVVCTPDHKFPIIGKGFVEAKDLITGEKFISSDSGQEITLINIEWLDEQIDTGTITVENEYHTFALGVGVFTKNSNLGEIDDTIYFRRRLYVALKIPPGYLDQDIASGFGRVSLSNQDIRFAKTIYRIQKTMSRSLREVCIRHLLLIGVPPDQLWDLDVKLIPSSPWIEISQNEITEARYNRAIAVRSANIYSLYDIYTDILKKPHEDALALWRRWRDDQIAAGRLDAWKAALSLEAQIQMNKPPQGAGAEGEAPQELTTGETEAPPPEETPPEETAGTEEEKTFMPLPNSYFDMQMAYET